MADQEEGRRFGLGWRPDIPDFRDHKLTLLPRTLQDVDQRPYLPPVYDQGTTSSCTGNAVAAAVEFDLNVQKLPHYQPSRLAIYYNGRSFDGTVNQPDAGAEIRNVIKGVVKIGVAREEAWPFSEDPDVVAMQPTGVAYFEARKDVIDKYARVPQTLRDIATALRYRPIVFGAMLYDSFTSKKASASGVIPMPYTDDSPVGGHAMLIVGISSTHRVFLVRNSWGSEWGDNGYCYMPFDYILNSDLTDDLWVLYSIR